MVLNCFNNSFPLSTIFFILFFLVRPSLCAPTNDVISCLGHSNINNFTTIPISENDSTAYYFKLLKFSIQNLRFADPKVPKPIAIILPETVEQIQSSVLCCTKLSVEIRVRCGGHSYEGTSSVANDETPFVIIDMINMNKVLVDLESETAWIEGGAILGETYYSIAAESSGTHGFSAGSCPTVGIGGHIGGGGFGLLSRKYGVAADNVVDALLVDANGRLLDREAMGEEVFWAIRGGGGGVWGIICAWKINLLHVPSVVTGFIVSRPGTKPQVAKLVHKWQYVAPNLVDDFYMSCFVGAALPETTTIGISATFKGFYLGPRHEAVTIINQAFAQLGISVEDCKEMSWIESVLYFSGLGNGATISDLKNRYLEDKNYFKAKSDYVKTPITFTGISAALDILEMEPKGYVIFDPYGGAMDRISSDSIAFPHREGNLFSIQYMVVWYEEDKERSDGYIEWIREFYKAMAPLVSWGPRAAYVNYMDNDLGVKGLISSSTSDSEDVVEIARYWGEKYFLKNYDRLVRAKTLIDPNNIFSHQQGIFPMPSISSSSSVAPLKPRVSNI